MALIARRTIVTIMGAGGGNWGAHGIMPGDPEECRRQARECDVLAARATTEQRRLVMERLAESWRKLALDIEASQALLDAYPGDDAGSPAPGDEQAS